jgi:hypothetical protein
LLGRAFHRLSQGFEGWTVTRDGQRFAVAAAAELFENLYQRGKIFVLCDAADVEHPMTTRRRLHPVGSGRDPAQQNRATSARDRAVEPAHSWLGWLISGATDQSTSQRVLASSPGLIVDG